MMFMSFCPTSGLFLVSILTSVDFVTWTTRSHVASVSSLMKKVAQNDLYIPVYLINSESI